MSNYMAEHWSQYPTWTTKQEKKALPPIKALLLDALQTSISLVEWNIHFKVQFYTMDWLQIQERPLVKERHLNVINLNCWNFHKKFEYFFPMILDPAPFKSPPPIVQDFSSCVQEIASSNGYKNYDLYKSYTLKWPAFDEHYMHWLLHKLELKCTRWGITHSIM